MQDFLITTSNIDILIFYVIHVNLQNAFFDVIMPIISNMSYFTFWILICIFIFIFDAKNRNIVLLCIIALIAGYFITDILKYLVARPRPYEVMEGIRILDPINGYSWPSGHTVASFISATILGKGYGYIFLVLVASLVAFSRVYNGVHYPSDVISGAIIGILIGLLFLRYENHIIGKINNFRKYLEYKK